MDVMAFGEIVVNQFLQSLGVTLQTIMAYVTELGSELVFFLIIPAIYWCVDAFIGLKVGCMLLLSNWFVQFFKILFKTPRPYWVSADVKPVVWESSFGLPSGHAMNSASVWGWITLEAKKRWVTALCLVVIFLIGFSRLVLGVHFLSDVLLGWSLGALLILAFYKLHRPAARWITRFPWQVQVLLIFASSLLMLLLSLIARSFPAMWMMPAEWLTRAGEIDPLSMDGTLTTAGVWFGMLAGFTVLLHFRGVLQSNAGGLRRLWRYLLGLAGFVILYAGLGSLFPEDLGLVSAVLRYFRYALIGIWISAISPLVFERLKIGEIKPLTGLEEQE